MSTNFTDKAIANIMKAQAFEEKDQYQEAIQSYKLSCDCLLHAAKTETNKKVKAALLAKVDNVLERAQQLKQTAKNQKQNENNNNSGSQKKEEEIKDKDKDKMESQLNSAIVVEKPNVKWDDVAGLKAAKATLHEAVVFPTLFPQMFKGARSAWKGILLYGPPGTGKSYLAKAVATECQNSTFFSVSASDIVSKYLGESEKLVRTLFESAREKSPSIIFIDEIDSMCGARGDNENESSRRIKTEFLVQMQGVGKSSARILVLGATNTPWQLDMAIRRRFEKRVYIPLPCEQARTQLFKIMTKSNNTNMSEEDYQTLAKMTDGFSGSDLDSVNRDALYEPVRLITSAKHFKKIKGQNGEDAYLPCSPGDPEAFEMTAMKMSKEMAGKVIPPPVTIKDYLRVVKKASKSVDQNDLKEFEEWTQSFGIDG